MNKEFEISTVEEFIQFLEIENLNSNEICQLLEKAFMLFADETKPPEVLIQEFRKYWERFKGIKERPLFLGLDLNVIEPPEQGKVQGLLFLEPIKKQRLG